MKTLGIYEFNAFKNELEKKYPSPSNAQILDELKEHYIEKGGEGNYIKTVLEMLNPTS